MPPAEAPPAGVAATVRGWGGGAGARVRLVRPRDVEEARAAVAWLCSPGRAARTKGAIARGLGRSYGDAAQLAGGHVLDMTELRGFELDAGAGTVTAAAGASIGSLLAVLVAAGWMLPVVPGTQHVTIGGAIAGDVHGKNHPSAGSFGAHVRALGLLTATGEVRELQPGGGLFAATVGGMGLTGVILWARVGLERVGSDRVAVDTDRVGCLDDALAILAAPGTASHRIAWLDLLGPSPGRGVVTSSEHAPGEPREPAGAGAGARAGARAGAGGGGATAHATLTVPRRWPGGVLRAGTVRAFNELRYRCAPRRERGRSQPLATHMFPLDKLAAWPRLYGRGGFLQYQFAVPVGRERVLEAVIAGLSRAGVPCFLATLKALGTRTGGPLSFPLEGWTLALDVPRAAAGVDGVLDSLDRLVAEAGGRVYLSKDARLRPAAVSAMYPRLGDWQAAREAVDPERRWRSDLAVRTGLIPGGEG